MILRRDMLIYELKKLIFHPCAGKETYCTDPCARKETDCTDPCAEKEFMALIHLQDVLTRRLEKKWSRGTAHNPWDLEQSWNKYAQRETFSSLISDKGKKTVSVLGHYFFMPYREEEIVSSYIVSTYLCLVILGKRRSNQSNARYCYS